ncbi:AAA family ATPase [Limnobaculum xujianqingii]|uniref:AAA family ATPase n=1 Tax=Limnobaculum xujianqingii TaxID=2738837 RepID=UPI00112639D4|nr:AAA family ATPase [Limnobaculum xujianqingii]
MSLVKNELIELMNLKGLSQSRVGQAINKSTATISLYLANKYNGDTPSLEADIQSFIERSRERDRSHNIKVPFIMTSTAKRGLELIKIAHESHEINVLYGEAGLGKTMILKRYADENRTSVLLIEVDPGYTAKVLLTELCKQLNLPTMGSLHELMEACIAKLKGSDLLLIIDEAELLSLRPLEVLRRIHDLSGVGLVLSGMPRLIMNLKGKRGELVQLYSRVAFALNLGQSLPQADVRAISSGVIDGLDDETCEAFYSLSHGNARRLSKLIQGTVRMCHISDAPISAAAVRKFSQMLIN